MSKSTTPRGTTIELGVVDWAELRRLFQQVLANRRKPKKGTKPAKGRALAEAACEGLLSFLDSVQDAAVAAGLSEDFVFGP